MGEAYMSLHIITEKTIITKTGKKWNEIKWIRLVIRTIARMITIIAVTIKDMKAGYMLGEFRSKINHLLFMDDLKLYGKTVQELHSLV